MAEPRSKSRWNIVEFLAEIETHCRQRPRHLRQESEEDDDARTSTSLLSLDLSVFLPCRPADRPTDRPLPLFSMLSSPGQRELTPRPPCSAVRSSAERAGRETREERRGERTHNQQTQRGRILRCSVGRSVSLCLPVDRQTKVKAEKHRTREIENGGERGREGERERGV